MRRAALSAVTVLVLAALVGRDAVPTARAAGFVWTGATSTDWFTPTNWSPVGVPGPDDTATIGTGTVDLPADATVGALTFSGGTLTGVGTLTLIGTSSWTGGIMKGSGTTVVPAGGTLHVSGPTMKGLDGRRLENAGTMLVSGTPPPFAFFGGSGFTLANGGTVDFGDGGNLMLSGPGGTIHNTGTLRKSAGTDVTQIFHRLDNDGTVDVQSGTLQIGGAFMTGGGTSGGAFTVVGGATLRFAPLGVTQDLAATSSVSGAGSVAFAAGTTRIGGAYDVAATTTIEGSGTVAQFEAEARTRSLALVSGTLSGSGNLTLTGESSWTGGSMAGAGATTVASGSALHVGTPTLKVLAGRRLQNRGTVRVAGVGAGFGFCGHTFLLDNVGLVDFGEDGSFTQCNAAVGTIRNAGTLRKSSGADVSTLAHTLNNDGVVDVGSGTLRLGGVFGGGGGTSTGAFTAAAGATLQFASSGVTHALAPGSSVSGAGAVTFAGTTLVQGGYHLAGVTTIGLPAGASPGTVDFAADASIPTLVMEDSHNNTLGGPATVTVTGTLDWRGGVMNGAGATVIAPGATAILTGSSTQNFRFHKAVAAARRFTNDGTVVLQDGANFEVNQSSTAVITNNGLFDCRTDGFIGSNNGQSASFVNNGTLRKSAGSGITRVTRILTFLNRGTIDVGAGKLAFDVGFRQTAGAIRLDGGSLSLSSPFSSGGLGTVTLDGGILMGNGALEGHVVSAATVSPGLAPGAAGTLGITGNYSQTASGILAIDIGGTTPGTQFDQLILGTEALTRTAALGGALDVRLVGGFTPAANDSFEVSRYSALASQFTAIHGLDIGNGQSFTPDYRPNNLVLISGEAGGGPATGCGGPARIWVHIVAPRTARFRNTPGVTLYRTHVLYGNSGGTGAFALITGRIKGLRPDQVVRAAGLRTEPLVPVTDPDQQQAFQSFPTVLTDTATGARSVPAFVFVPPDNPACRGVGEGGEGGGGGGEGGDGGDGGGDGGNGGGDGSAGGSGGGGGAAVPPPASFIISVSTPDDDGGGGGSGGGSGGGGGGGSGGGGGAGGGGSNGCDSDVISENDLRATQVDVARIATCMPALGDFLRETVPGPANDIFSFVEDASAASGDPAALAAVVGSTAVGAVVDIPGSGLLDLADAALGAAEACQLGPDGFARNETKFVFSCDPNDKVGSTGVGTAQFISGEVPTPYTVFFENKPDATAPAQDVVITDQLDLSRLDASTFQLGAIRFGAHVVVPPPGRSEFNTDVDLRPDNDLIARIQARLDKDTGLLTWRFASIDPETLLPTEEPLAGLLPPNGDFGEGEGSVLFTVRPRAGLASGTAIENAARIVFDTNAPIDTPVWRNTIDNAAPVSRVEALPPVVGTETFLVQWSGVDGHSGIANFTVLVSEDGAPFQVWQRNTTEVSAAFDGRQGRSYAFFSQARDLTGNLEAAKTAPEASTRVEVDLGDRTPPSVSCPAGPTVSAEPGLANAAVSYPEASATDDRPGVTVACAPSSGSRFALGATEVTCTARDAAGNEAACVFPVTVVDAEPPVVAPPPDRAAEATSPAGAVVTDAVLGSAVVADNAPGVTVVRSGVPAGNVFPIGTTSVVYTAVDLAGNAASAIQRVTVGDATPPTITIDAPAATRYGVGQVVIARYACADVASVEVACVGTVEDGAEIATAAGTHTFTVTATDASGNVATRTVSYTVGSSLAFASARSGNGDVYVINADGSGLRVVAGHPAPDFDPALSPDGARLAFVSGRSGAGDIYVAGTDGGTPVRVAGHVAPDLDPTFSPDGTRIAFVSYRSGGGDIYLVGADGSGLVRLTDSGHADLDPVFSPDGTQLAFVSTRSGNGDLYVVNTDGSGLRRLTSGPAPELTPTFSPDGTRIAFVSLGTGLGDVYVVNVDGTGLTRLTNHVAPDLQPRFSPDGTKLVFVSGRSGFGDVYVMNADGAGARPLAGHSAVELDPAFGPAGEVAFVSWRSGHGDVYAVQPDGTGLRNLSDHPASDGDLAWR